MLELTPKQFADILDKAENVETTVRGDTHINICSNSAGAHFIVTAGSKDNFNLLQLN